MNDKSRPVSPTTMIALILGAVLVLLGGYSLASATPMGYPASIPEPQWGTDIRVNPTSTAPLAAARNFSLAINPQNTNMVLAGYDDTVKSDRRSAFARSTDKGLTWITGVFNGPWGADLTPLGDTQAGFDAAGVGYYTSHAQGANGNGYFVLTTTNGINWSTPVPIVATDWDEFHYQSNLAIDQRTSGAYAGSLYFSYLLSNNSPPYFQGMKLRYSRDRGQTWSTTIHVSDQGNHYSRSPSMAVASNGTLYLAYEQLDNYQIKNPYRLYLDRSTDGGMTWGTDRLITGEPITPIGIPDYKYRELVLPADETCIYLTRIFHYVHIAVSPQNPNVVYAVWNDGRWDTHYTACAGSGRHGDIAFTRTTDGGATWSPVTRLNDDAIGNGVDQYQPTIGVAADGTIGVIWYDRRWDPEHWLYDVAYTQSTDGGVTWSQNVRVTDVSSDARWVPDYKNINDVSHRKSLVYGPDYALPTWIDTRRGDFQGDFMTDHGAFTVVTPTPTATNTAISTPVPTNSPTVMSTNTATPQPTHTTGVPPTLTPTPPPPPCTLSFNDVPRENPFYDAIRCLACRGIVSGYDDGNFRPGNEVTRGQLAKIVSNAAGYAGTPHPQIFEDVPPGHVFYEWINRLARRGHMGGYECGGAGEPCVTGMPYFRPFANATRGQTSKIVANAAEIHDPVSGQTFEDVPNTHAFYEWIEKLAGRGVMGGYECGGPGEPCMPGGRAYFRPGNNVTRGQSAKIVANTFYPNCQTP